MDAAVSFRFLVSRVRAGDPDAAAELVRRYEPEIRREVRLRLVDPRLRRVLDSMDICQSVLGSFFVRAGAGQYELDDAGQLVRLLVRMARNKVADQARRGRSERRDSRRTRPLESTAGGPSEPVAREPTPSRILAGRELLAALRDRLSEDERRLADLRAEGLGWEEVAGRVGAAADACRKRLRRALDRAVADLGVGL